MLTGFAIFAAIAWRHRPGRSTHARSDRFKRPRARTASPSARAPDRSCSPCRARCRETPPSPKRCVPTCRVSACTPPCVAEPKSARRWNNWAASSPPGADQQTGSVKRCWPGSAEAEGPLARRHHAPCDVAAGVHADAHQRPLCGCQMNGFYVRGGAICRSRRCQLYA